MAPDAFEIVASARPAHVATTKINVDESLFRLDLRLRQHNETAPCRTSAKRERRRERVRRHIGGPFRSFLVTLLELGLDTGEPV